MKARSVRTCRKFLSKCALARRALCGFPFLLFFKTKQISVIIIFFTFTASGLSAAPLVPSCGEDLRLKCGSWSVGGYYSVSPEGYWFAGVSGGAEYFFLRNAAVGISLSPGLGDGYFYLAPSFDVNYYLWHNERIEIIAGYSFRYFYDWPTRKGDAESDGTFHGPGISAMYGLTEQLYSGVNVSYQWIRFGGESYREWYFTLPVFYSL